MGRMIGALLGSFTMLAASGSCGSGSGGTLQQRLQGAWGLTALSCNGVSQAGLPSSGFSFVVTVSGSTYSLVRVAGGCKVTDNGSIQYDEATSTIVITASAPQACDPAGCESGCGMTGSGGNPVQVSTSGNTMHVSNTGAGFPNNICEGISTADPPGVATFTRQ